MKNPKKDTVRIALPPDTRTAEERLRDLRWTHYKHTIINRRLGHLPCPTVIVNGQH